MSISAIEKLGHNPWNTDRTKIISGISTPVSYLIYSRPKGLPISFDFITVQKQAAETLNKLKQKMSNPISFPTTTGTLLIGNNTWLKTSVGQSKDLPDDQKYWALRNDTFEIIETVSTDVKGHYFVKLRSPIGKPFPPAFKDGCFVWINDAAIKLDKAEHPDDVGFVPPVIKVYSPANPPTITDKKRIQEQLIRIGLLDPTADGKWGPQSQSAWRAFCRVIGDFGIEITTEKVKALCEFKGFKDLAFTASDPSDPENVLAVRCIQRMVKLGQHLTISFGSDSPTFNIVYLSGTDSSGKLNNDTLDDWNDLRMLIEISQSGLVRLYGCWRATIDAGKYWRGSNRMNSDGALQIDKDRQYLKAWAMGRHGSRQYPALVQVGELSGTRDRTGNGRTSDDLKVSGSAYGLNQHHGYDNRIRVGIMSAGCLVGLFILGHQKFIAFLKKDRRFVCNNSYAWSTSVLEGKNL